MRVLMEDDMVLMTGRWVHFDISLWYILLDGNPLTKSEKTILIYWIETTIDFSKKKEKN